MTKEDQQEREGEPNGRKYGRYEFTITIAANADTPEEAWNEAVEAFSMDAGTYPEDYKFEEEDDGNGEED